MHRHGPVLATLVVGLLCLTALFFREARAAVEVWDASTAYSHCYLVLPMAIYLLWERRSVFSRIEARPEIVWAVMAIPITIFWLVAERLGIMEGRQLAAIAGVEVLLLTVLGRALFAKISGPLLFLFFLVPFGAFLTSSLQRFTAGFTVTGLDLLGIPNYSDNFIIETQAGTFFVAEACAGLRFLIAAVAFGVFYALLTYTSFARRLAFIVASIVVPIVANGFRALGIVVLGQILGSAEAAAADHIIYGWVFFSAVMLLLIAVGQMFRDDPEPIDNRVPAVQLASSGRAGWSALAVVALLFVGPAAAAAIDTRLMVPVLGLGDAFVSPVGCTTISGDRSSDAAVRQVVARCGGIEFAVRLEAFSPRSTASAMVVKRRLLTQEVGAEDVAIRAADVPEEAGYWTVVQTTDPNRVTAYATWIDGRASRGGLMGRAQQAVDSLLGSNYQPALLTVTTAEAPNSPPAVRQLTLDTLLALLRAQNGLNARVDALTSLAIDARR